MQKLKVSIIIPTKNEEASISKCLDSLINSNYPVDNIEIFVVDGLSDDRTPEIVKNFSAKYPQVKLLVNEKRITPVARNIGIRHSTGDYIMFFDGHSIATKDYIYNCVYHIQETDADNVGGVVITIPKKGTLRGKVIANLLSSRFGVGGSKFRTGISEPEEVDTVPFGFYRKEVFEKVGLFNENFVRNLDIEFNLRLKRAGGKIILFPDIKLTYLARSNFLEFWKNNYKNGYWILYGLKFTKIPFSFRHVVPLFFSLFIFLGLLFSLFSGPLMNIFFAIVLIYLAFNTFFSIKVATKTKSLSSFFLAFIGFFGLHLSYGIGSFVGLIKILFGVKR